MTPNVRQPCNFCGKEAAGSRRRTLPEAWVEILAEGSRRLACEECLQVISAGRRWPCVGCGVPIPYERRGPLYCSERCSDVARLVRYRRAVEADGRIGREDVQLALREKEAWVLSGLVYRPRLTAEQREEVFVAKGRQCVICGATATDIDHITGRGGDELANLRPLCHTCHLKKSNAGLVTLTPEDPRYPVVQQRWFEYQARVLGLPTLRPCDDQVRWPTIQTSIAAARRRFPSEAPDTDDGGDALEEALWAHGVLPGEDPALEAELLTELEQPDSD